MTDLNKEDTIEKKGDPAKKDEKKELTLEEKYQIVIRYVADDNKLTDSVAKFNPGACIYDK